MENLTVTPVIAPSADFDPPPHNKMVKNQFKISRFQIILDHTFFDQI